MTKSILSPVEYQERRDLLLALLEEQPYTIGQLSALMQTHRGAVAMALRRLAREQLVHRGADDRWRLGVRAASAVDAARVDDPDALEADDLDVDGDDDLDVDGDDGLDVDEVEPPVERRRALRQPAATNLIAADTAPSWWCSAPRDGFSRRAILEHRRMRSSKEAH